MATFEERRAAALARAAKAQEKIAAGAPDPEEVELAKLEREAEEAEALAAAITAHGRDRVKLIRTPNGPVVLKTPSKAEYQRWLDADGSKTSDTYAMVRSCVVTPLDKFDATLGEYPGLLKACLEVAAGLAAAGVSVDSGK